MSVELDILDESAKGCALSDEELELIANKVVDTLGICRVCMISLTIVDDCEIHQLNLQWRQVDRPTDVLSFECEKPDDSDLGEGEPCELGDIVLAPDYIASQAKEFGTSEKDETRLLFIHGILHLLGYDHEEDQEAHRMQGLEEDILAEIPNDKTLKAHVLIRHRQED